MCMVWKGRRLEGVNNEVESRDCLQLSSRPQLRLGPGKVEGGKNGTGLGRTLCCSDGRVDCNVLRIFVGDVDVLPNA